MPTDPKVATVRHFFLNERQELATFDREGGGRPAQYVPINWGQRSVSLSASLNRAATTRSGNVDPTASRHSFVVAIPVPRIEKFSQSKKAPAGGKVTETPEFGGEHAKVFRRLGMDFLELLPEGKASVHISSTNLPKILGTLESLASATDRERFRWISLEKFEPVDWKTRVDVSWLESLRANEPHEVTIRFQPILTRLEVQDVLQALALRVRIGNRTRLLRAGREFSGRYWCTGLLTSNQIREIAQEFASAQSIHPPIRTAFAAAKKQPSPPPKVTRKRSFTPVTPTTPVTALPTVAVVDSGIPEGHPELATYRRPGYRNPDVDPTIMYMGDHGSTVASAVVFGHRQMTTGVREPVPGSCRVLDVMISHDLSRIEDELLITALEAIVGTAADVRVFNLSFDGPPLVQLSAQARREYLLKLENLDNFAFARDALLVVAAGNSPRGIAPSTAYPNHQDDERWQLGAYARSFNAAVCGSYVDVVSDNAVAGVQGAPSPFTRIGPGLCESPVPGFSAPGGDCLPNYEWAPSTGVWVSTSAGMWEDHCGTSIAAPLVSREAAWAFQELVKYCAPGTSPFAGTVKAWMHYSASRPPQRGAYERLAKRTLGQGMPSADLLRKPIASLVCFVWQTMLQAADNVARVRFPVPLSWLEQAAAPRLRVVASWNAPVSSALTDFWACRKASIKVRPFGATAALLGGGQADGAFPLIDREWDIAPASLTAKKFEPTDEFWILECEYEELGPYPIAMTVSPQQRVGVVISLSDASEAPLSPQGFVQTLPIAVEMDRLSQLQVAVLVPIALKP